MPDRAAAQYVWLGSEPPCLIEFSIVSSVSAFIGERTRIALQYRRHTVPEPAFRWVVTAGAARARSQKKGPLPHRVGYRRRAHRRWDHRDSTPFQDRNCLAGSNFKGDCAAVVGNSEVPRSHFSQESTWDGQRRCIEKRQGEIVLPRAAKISRQERA